MKPRYAREDVLALHFYHDVTRFATRYAVPVGKVMRAICEHLPATLQREQAARYLRGKKVLETARLITVRVRSDGLDEQEKDQYEASSDWVQVDGGWCALRHVG